MVYYFTSTADPSAQIYMGKDKHENEFLIKFAQHHDIWFHVDSLSSAHVYLRTQEPITSYDSLSAELIQECCQLTKANSIEGCKKHSVGINYTWATNLLKTADMQTGAVSFTNRKLVKLINIEKNKDIIRAVMKTKKEDFPDFAADHQIYLKEVQASKNAVTKAGKIAVAEEEKQAHDKIAAKQQDLDDFFGGQDEDEMHYAGDANN